MAVPQGAASVTYTFRLSDGDPEFELRFQVPVQQGDSGELADTVAAVGAAAMLDYLRNAFPARTARTTRSYEGYLTGDPWPPAPAEDDGTPLPAT
ncbi:hypothetical protein [Streptomyces sp. NPDC049881]|uniref:hypothetical protein n=1 Tax=Streptomyces sp. NPDC049881 TaxID=3155778 RepID=UPI00343DF211